MKDKNIKTFNDSLATYEDVPELKIKKNIIGKISTLFVERFELAILLMGLLLVLGITSFLLLPKESLPEIVFPTLTVQTVYPGASPTDVENLVTAPLENKLSSLDDVAAITSNSNYGFSFIVVSFEETVDITQKKTELDSALTEVNLPNGAFDPISSTFNTSEIPLLSLSITGNYSVYELNQYAEVLKNQISKLSGVEDVMIYGGVEREIQINLDPEKLSDAGLTSDQISSTLSGDNLSFPLGSAEIDNSVYSLRIDETLNSIEDIENTLVYNNQGEGYFISELGTVVDGSKPLTEFNRSYTKESGLNNSVFISVIRKNRNDVVGTSDAVKSTVNEAVGVTVPSDLNVIVSNDTATSVEEDLNNIQTNALSGLLVVILVLFLFIGFRESLIVSITIPLTLLTTLGLLSFFGITLNTFAILGLIVALGLLVDNTIIVMENMDRLRKKGASVKDSAIFGTNQVGYPIASATLTTVAAFLPLAILPGIIGAFINTIPRTIIITLVSSLLLAITITPSVYYFVNKRFKAKSMEDANKGSFVIKLFKVLFVAILSVVAFYSEDIWIGIPIIATVFFVAAIVAKEFFSKGKGLEDNKLVAGYKSFIMSITKSPLKMASVFAIAIAVLASSILLITSGKLKIAFFPTSEPISVSLTVDTPPGTTLEDTSNIISEIEGILMSLEDVEQFNTTIGGNELDSGSIIIDLAENENTGYDQLETIRDSLSGITTAIITYQGNGAAGPPVGKPIEIKIVGDDLLANKALSDVFATELAAVNGTYNIQNSIKEGSKELLFNLDPIKVKELGVSNSYISFATKQLIDGQIATTISQNNQVIDVRVKVEGNTIENFENLTLSTPFGTTFKLSDVATLEESIGVSGVVREDGNRTITLSSDLENGVNAADALASFQTRIKNIELPEGTTIDYGGDSAGISESFGDLFRSLIIAIFLVFIILTIQFGSIKQPFAIITTIPMALIGVLYGLTLTGNEFGFYAFMALISLVGIAVNDAIVLIDYMNYLRKEGYEFFEAIGEATRTRFNPVLATTLTTIGGILPLSFKNAYYAQFGYSLIFGLLITTLMTLILIPIMYSVLEGKDARSTNKRIRIKEEKVVLRNQYQN